MIRRLWIDEFYAGYRRATNWRDLPEPEKQNAIKILKKEVGLNPFKSNFRRRWN